MTTPLLDASLTYSSGATAPPGPSKLRMREWLREPLLHFLALGGMLFAVDHLLMARTDDPRRIVVGPAVVSEAVATFEAARGRPPTTEELAALQKVWLDNEVLYREGLALQVDKGDPAIRERVIFKALSVIDSGVKLPAISEEELRSWFEAHRAKYDEPARYDFEEAALTGASSEQAVRDFVAALNAGTPGDAQAGLRVFKGRPHQNLVESYGPELARSIEQAPPGQWQALPTKDGFRALRLQKITPPRSALFESLRGVVMQDWKDAEASQQRSAAVKALSKKYEIRYDRTPERK